MDALLYLQLVILLILLVIVRILYLIHKITTGYTAHSPEKRKTAAKTIICIGSGGHTTEILHLLKNLDVRKYSPRYYLLAKSDVTSFAKVAQFEGQNKYTAISIPRSRIVGQSYLTSVVTTLYTTIYSIPIMLRIRPDLILCNGPGTCIPICIIAFLLKAAFICNTRIVFVESFCRTKTFSLSGKILIYFADNIVVQWPSLKQKLKRATYIGQLV